jgi:DNA-binding Lrp family transcriptional regulator
MKAYVLINASQGVTATEVARKMQGQAGIAAADAITGEYDVIAVCEAPDVNAIGRVVMEKIQKVEGVFKTITCLVIT